MQVKRLLASVVIAASMGIGVLQAQDMADVQVPAEFPPASYKARQYVDSRGCVYVRAGIDGNVNWVPRVSRSREPVCGFKPSFAGSSAPARTTAAQPKAKPEQIRIKPASQPKPKAKPAPKRTAKAKVVKRPAPAAKPVQITTPAAMAPKAKTVKVVKRKDQAPKPTAQPKRSRTAKTVPAPKGQPACAGASAVSRQYYRTAPGTSVRCGPQAAPHVSVVQSRTARANAMRAPRASQVATDQTAQPAPQPVIRRAAPQARTAAIGNQTRVAPKHVYGKQKQSTVGISVPDGYKPVWEDDRLNTKRAHQTFEGMARMEVAWSNTVPRYLVDRNTGRDISYMYPGLQYPYTSFEAQRAAGVTVATQGRVVMPPQRVGQTNTRRAAVSTRQTDRRKATVSTRSVTPEASGTDQAAQQKKMVRKAASPYIQVGAFRDAGHAQRAAQGLANAGLPTRMGRVTRGSDSFTMVKVGPFRTQPQLDRALHKVRGKGFGQARPSH
ncbi:SPOR domain-containing protein [Roseovarius sp. MMSF_3281]|uniref:SPOR domain-containing protein n=1 Tax=Roseovarius sp. MMSF_3281 TaxID=3046694 RepID=UPI00273F2487|nr:SPOR domain-containing protein [Roseovarius sp. MMSF_3281]